MNASHRFAGIIENLLENYDSALFGLLAPFIAPLFFPDQDPLTSLILTYGMLPLGFLTRPIGSLFFGWIGDRWGRRKALICSLTGMAIVTFSMGSLPTYGEIGLFAPAFLALGKMLQSFFIAGEHAGGAIFVLEHTSPSKRGLNSGFYDSSSIVGILIASAMVAWLSHYGVIQEGWRVLFWLGGITALAGLYIRWKIPSDKFEKTHEGSNLLQTLKEQKRALFSIALAAGFSYTIYHTAFTLMNGFVPLVTTLSKSDVMMVNTALLVVDMLLLPLFGYLSDKIGKEKVMFTSAMLTALLAIPLFTFIEGASLLTVIAIRFTIVLFGIAFAAPYHAWALEQVPPKQRYRILSLGSAIGSQLIGMPTAMASLWIYQMTGWAAAPGLYIMVVSLAAGYAIWRRERKTQALVSA